MAEPVVGPTGAIETPAVACEECGSSEAIFSFSDDEATVDICGRCLNPDLTLDEALLEHLPKRKELG